MTYFEHCAAIEQTLLILLLFAASLVQLFLTVEDAAGGRYRRLLLDGLLLIGALLLCGDLLGIAGRIDGRHFFSLPAAYLWILEGELLLYGSFSYAGALWRKKHVLSRDSIKEGSDNLPDGICFFDDNGAVRLINRKMMSLGIMLFSKEIQTLDELHLALLHPAGGVECLDEGNWLYRFPDGTVRRFSERTFIDEDESMVTEIIAVDVTELYAKQAELNRENTLLAEANRNMKQLLDNMEEIVREEEILSMKMRIHDDIGHSILAARKALLQQQDIAVIRRNAALWEKAVNLLDRVNHLSPVPDEWEQLQSRARDLGVELDIGGELPEHEILRHLVVLSVRECVTNCVRHARGDKVFVRITPSRDGIICRITNNGKAPTQSIVEGGGLSGLRRRIEREGGNMKLQSSPAFALIVTLPLKEEL